LTGCDKRVIDYLQSQPEVEETVTRLADLLAFLMPRFEREGKSYLTVGVGCTGGRHRSVMVAEELASRLRQGDSSPKVVHRDIDKDEARYSK
jgi:UPF0042 nucleotide-binding protein